jgi:vanillate O-demethylase ferredoxin subunit
VRQLEIQPTSGVQPFTAGAHLDVSVLINDQPEIRSYSLLPSISDDSYRIAVKRLPESRGGSVYMWSLMPGARLQISQPQNHFELTLGRSSYILVAGGIGITPIFGMALLLMGRVADLRLHYCGSSRAAMPFLSELQNTLAHRLHIHASDEGNRLDFEKLFDELPANTQVYLCGPLRMLDAARHAWQKRSLPPNDLRYETFGASGQFAAQPFRVKVPRMNLDFIVGAPESLLDALNRAGATVISDCQRGECGLCTVDILSCSGVVDHRDFFFSDAQKAENKKMCACVSRVVNGDVEVDTAYRGRV